MIKNERALPKPNRLIARRVPSNQGGADTAFTLLVNGVQYSADAEPETPLLWVLRDSIGLTGTKYGCGIGQCGACTVLIDGVAVRSCFLQASRAIGRKITTIEGLSTDGSHPVQLAWKEFDVPQCGYCQSGLMAATTRILFCALSVGAVYDRPLFSLVRHRGRS